MNCTFFGHHDAPEHIKPKLKETILNIFDRGVSSFYVGNNGRFDFLVQEALNELNKSYSIKYSIILSYLNEKAIIGNQENTLYPEELEGVYQRFAISKRNEWLLKKSSIIIAYVQNSFSNAYKWIEKARKKGLIIINLASADLSADFKLFEYKILE